MKTVAILHGWAGGNWHTKKFSRALAKEDIKAIKDPTKANIIFAHSAGCYRLPGKMRAELVVLVGVPYWPDKSILRRAVKKKNTDWSATKKLYGTAYATKKSLWEFIYVLIKPAVTVIAVLNHDRLGFLEQLRSKRVLIIRNQDDFFCSPDIKKIILKYPNIRYAELPGVHDDYYMNPRPYVDLILKEL